MGNNRREDEFSGREKENDGFSFENKISGENVDATYEEHDFEGFDDQDKMEAYLSDSIAEVTGEEKKEPKLPPVNVKPNKKKWSKKKKLFVGLGTFVGTVMIAVFCIFSWVMFGINRDNGGVWAATDLTAEELAAQSTVAPYSKDQQLLDADVVNILLIGREGINDGDGAFGRSDSMIIASMNTKTKELKMVSLMRDCYVSIPGYKDNKLNAAYSFGGGELLMQTIYSNFGVPVEGYVVVDFKAFEKVIDAVGGVDLQLTNTEANYLNTTNYISKKKNRHVKAGTYHANGNQALGYCRVRKVAAYNGENNDYGRTFRQRAVLNQVYSRVMSELSPTEALALANELIGYVTVSDSLTTADLLKYAKYMLSMNVSELLQLRVPVDGAFTGTSRGCGSCLVLDFAANNAKLWEFLYGTTDRDIYTINPASSYDSSSSTTTSGTTTTKAPTSVTTKPTTATTKAPVPVETKGASQTEVPVTEVPVTEVPVTEAPKPTKVPATPEPAPVTEAPAAEDPSDGGDESVGFR